MKKKLFIFIVLYIISCCSVQSDENNNLNIFGSLQTIVFSENFQFKVIKPIDSIYKTERISFAMKQLDLYLNKNLNDNFNVFIDLEMKLNFSSEKNWGDINLQEAWLKYENCDYYNIKFGLLNPKFNNLNEIRNRLVLIPTIFRPIVYEGLLSNVFSSEDFVPEKAFLQISGLIPFGVLSFDYAVYWGNGESSFISNNDGLSHNDSISYISGVDNIDFDNKLFGARIGITKNDETFKTGISITKDSDNKLDTTYLDMGIKLIPQGMIPRLRIGFDLSFEFWKFEILSEYIHVFYDKNKISKDIQLSQQFLFATLIFNILDDLYTYGTYQFMEDNFLKFDSKAIVIGFGYKINESIVAKTEWIRYNQVNMYPPKMPSILATPGLETAFTVNYLMAGVNVFF